MGQTALPQQPGAEPVNQTPWGALQSRSQASAQVMTFHVFTLDSSAEAVGSGPLHMPLPGPPSDGGRGRKSRRPLSPRDWAPSTLPPLASASPVGSWLRREMGLTGGAGRAFRVGGHTAPYYSGGHTSACTGHTHPNPAPRAARG